MFRKLMKNKKAQQKNGDPFFIRHLFSFPQPVRAKASPEIIISALVQDPCRIFGVL